MQSWEGIMGTTLKNLGMKWWSHWRGDAMPHAHNGVTVSLDELLQLRAHAAGLDPLRQRKVMTLMAGGYHSGLRGRGFDFAETRHYLPGDDIRSLDWRVTARYGIPHTKVFQEERERPVFILVDYAPSMYFGTRTAFKSVVAARAAALLTWAASVRGDRVGGAVFNGALQRELRPSGRRGALRLLNAVAELHAQNTSQTTPYDLNHALKQARQVVRPGSLVCIVSDFYALNTDGEKSLQALASHTNVLGLFIYDALEAVLPPPGYYTVCDDGHRLSFDSSITALRAAYEAQFNARYARVQHIFMRRGLRLLSLATHASLSTILREEIK
jgi:uncharacterized protein (DUF58 family)